MKTQTRVLSDLMIVKTDDLARSIIRDLLLCVFFSFFIALCAQVSVPFFPVPLTGQTFAVLLTGLVLGSRRGLAALILYVFEGAIGLPVFTPGLTMGIARLAGPTGGYLLGFIAAAWFLGFMAERGCDRGVFKSFFIMLLGLAIIYSLGLLRLSAFVPFDKLFMAGLFIFIPGEAIKVVLASLILPTAWKLVK